MDQRDYAVCAFYMREDAGMHRDGMKYKYTQLWLEGPALDGKLYTPHPPLVGDTLPLGDQSQGIFDTFEVVARDISYPSYESANWPLGQNHADTGPHIVCIVVRATGPFRDEVLEISQDGRG